MLPLRFGLVVLLELPLLIASASPVEAKKVLNEIGAAPAVRCQFPPGLVPDAPRVTERSSPTVRLVKFAVRVADVSAPGVLFWFVGCVAVASVYVAVPVRTSARY